MRHNAAEKMELPDSERRRYPRLPGKGLIANIAGRLVNVVDVSATGMTVERQFEPSQSEPTSFVLYPCDGNRLDLNRGVKAKGIVVHLDETTVGLKFEPASLALVKLIVGRIL